MEMRIQKDTRIVLSLTEAEVLKLLTYIEYSELVSEVAHIRTYDSLELENFVYSLAREVELLIEDKLEE